MQANSISIVIPVYNDEEVLSELLKRLNPVVSSMGIVYEMIFVDDGSKDNSFKKLKEIQKEYSQIRLIKLARNFGQQNSIAAGLTYAKGEYIVLMDSDLQDRPEDILKLIEAMEGKDSDMAIAKWITREDSFLKKFVSNFFFEFSRKTTGIKYEKGLGVFRVIRKSVIDQVVCIPENTGTILSLIYWAGIDYATVPLKRDARFAGKSGYNLRKMFQLTSDRIFSYSLFPIRLATRFGLLLGLGSFLFALFLVLRYFIDGNIVAGYTSTMVINLFLFGINFSFLGIIGEYLGRIYRESKGRPKFIVSRIIEDKK